MHKFSNENHIFSADNILLEVKPLLDHSSFASAGKRRNRQKDKKKKKRFEI